MRFFKYMLQSIFMDTYVAAIIASAFNIFGAISLEDHSMLLISIGATVGLTAIAIITLLINNKTKEPKAPEITRQSIKIG